MAFCSNCGQKLMEGAKFCSECGIKIEAITQSGNEQRKVYFDGEIHKCPNCGASLNSFVANCPSCGYELRGVSAVGSVRELADKLQAIEEKRGAGNWADVLKQKFLNKGRLSWVDQQKISLIKNYGIPNTKEDILEFLIMASAQKSAFKDGIGNEIPQIYDAWDMKMEQAFQKAILNFGADTEYLNKLKLLMDKKHKKIIEKKLMKNGWRNFFMQ